MIPCTGTLYKDKTVSFFALLPPASSAALLASTIDREEIALFLLFATCSVWFSRWPEMPCKQTLPRYRKTNNSGKQPIFDELRSLCKQCKHRNRQKLRQTHNNVCVCVLASSLVLGAYDSHIFWWIGWKRWRIRWNIIFFVVHSLYTSEV